MYTKPLGIINVDVSGLSDPSGKMGIQCGSTSAVYRQSYDSVRSEVL
jgi:hypothetical protein